jgi:2-methylisocitrate lyase-like PEP mutase family enzyme
LFGLYLKGYKMAIEHDEKTARFRALHKPGEPFVIPNPWDQGSARILEGLGFKALATTSSGFALTKGRRDYGVTRDEALDHCRDIAGAVDIPVTADLENGFGARPEDAAETIRLAALTPLCGGSIEDASGNADEPVFSQSLAVERIAAAAEAARAAPNGFVLTARAEAFLYGRGELDEIITRLNQFADAGADILYAPGLPDMDAVRTVCAAVSKPVNVLIYGDLKRHNVTEFADAGVARLSIGGGLASSAYGTLASAAQMLQDGRFGALTANSDGAKQVGQWLK